MTAIKFLGLIITLYTFIVLEAYGQNFYPARYGKRDENAKHRIWRMQTLVNINIDIVDAYQSKDLLENKRIGRGENQNTVNRKMGFFISGGRFGKRGCSENCYEGDVNSGSKEIIGEGYHIRQDRSDRIRIPIRKNQFMVGSRFGKRQGQIDILENGNIRNLRCSFISVSDLFKCLEREGLNNEDEFSSSSDFV